MTWYIYTTLQLYLVCPESFKKNWTGPYKVVTRLLDLNYEIVDQQNKKTIFHVNRLKPNYNPQNWKPKLKQKGTKNLPKKPTSYQEEEKQEDKHYIGRFPLRTEVQLQNRTSPGQTPSTLEPDPTPADISISENSPEL
jgi:hypothetical protein